MENVVNELLFTRELTTSREGLTTSTPTSVYPNQAHIITVATLFITIGVVGMMGNCLVLIAVSLSQKLQTATNAFVVNLSISDFLTCCVMPFHAVGVLSSAGWPMSDLVCKLIAALTITTPSCSVLTLAMIALNRYVLITKTKKTYQRIYKLAVTGVLVAATWLCPIIFLIVPQLTSLGALGYDTYFKICKWDIYLAEAPVYQSVTFVIFLGSTAVIIFCYVSIYLYVRKHIKGMQSQRQSQVISIQNVNTEDTAVQVLRQRSPTNMQMNSTPSIKQVKITKNLSCVVIVFFVCVVPYSILLLTRVRQLGMAYLAILFTFSSNINPILYAAKHPDFNMVFTYMLHCKYSDIPMPSNCLRSILLKNGTTLNIRNSSE